MQFEARFRQDDAGIKIGGKPAHDGRTGPRIGRTIRLSGHSILMAIGMVCLLVAGLRTAVAAEAPPSVPADVAASLDRLVQMAADSASPRIDSDELVALIRFTQRDLENGEGVPIPTYVDATSALYRFDIHRNLRRILEIGYHTDIPGFIISPSSVRTAHWKSVDGSEKPLPKLWLLLDDLSTGRIVLRGVEYEEITPDQFTGTYYAYDVQRLLILMRHQGRPVLVSVSRQKGVSEVGRKGAVFGKDDDWTYLYSGEKGMNSRGLGWVDSYMYAASTVMVYEELAEGSTPLVRCTVFKWLRAGWSGINMVQTHHILAGMDRYAKAFRQVVESKNLPSVDEIARICRKIRSMDESELRESVRNYFVRLKDRIQETGSSVAAFYTKHFGAEGHALAGMTVEQMRSLLVLETLKMWMGKSGAQHLVDGDIVSARVPSG